MRYEIQGKLTLQEYGQENSDEYMIDRPIVADIFRIHHIGTLDSNGGRTIIADNWRIVNERLSIDVQGEDFDSVLESFFEEVDMWIGTDEVPFKGQPDA